jgi:hypothetical protein
MPMIRSGMCWNPAVPPPPVAGAAVGTGVAVGLGVTVGDGLGVAVGEGDGLVVGLGLVLGLVLGDALGEPDAVADVPTEDEGVVVGSAPEDGDPEQAETATTMSTVKMPKPTAASLAFMEPPRCVRPKAPRAIKQRLEDQAT